MGHYETQSLRVGKMLLLLALAAASLYLNVQLLADVRRARANAPRTVTRAADAYSYVGQDHPAHLPVARRAVRMVVEESARYALASAEAQAEWVWTGPVGDHAIRLGAGQHGFAVAMFHELHCLRILRRTLAGGAYPRLDPVQRGHLHHCFEYLRQWTLCAADVTLEPGDFAQRNFTAERVGATHTCREWEPVYDMVNAGWDSWEEYRIAHGVPEQL